MNSPPRIKYSPHPGATLQSEAEALAAVYRVLLESYESKALQSVSDDEEEDAEEASAAMS